MFRFLGIAGLFFLVSAAQAVDSRFELLLDLDNDPASGCTVATSAGPFDGADAIVTSFVATSGLADAMVTSVERRDCVDPGTDTFGPPQIISPGDWPVGIGNGEAGFNVIETFVPVSPGQWYQDIRVGLIASDEFGNVSALLSAAPGGGPIVISGLPTIPVPLVSPIFLALLALVFLAIGIAVISRRGRLTLTALAFLGLGGAAAAACVLDGEIFDWSLEDLLATGSATDPDNGVDLRALFGKLDTQSSQLCFRIDAALVFSDAPQAEADNYIAVETNLLDIPAGSGLLVNDNLGIPDADLVSFGGGDLGGTPADNAPGATIVVGADGSLTVNADGSFTFEAETGFEGDFEFFYRLENIAGQSDGLVTIEVQSLPVAQDDAYDVVDTDILSVPAPGVLTNDSGLPVPQVSSFGGGDLGGVPGDNAAGSSVVVGGDGSLTLNVDGSLTFDPPSGQTGPFGFDYVIDNPAGSATATVTITINQAPSITSADAFVCSVGNVCAFDFTAEGFPAPTITLAGALPSGVTFNAVTEALEGTPDAGSGAEYVLTVTAANGIGTDAEQTFTLTINEAPAITSADTLGCEVETDCDFNVTADGFPAPTFDLPGLPAGLSLDAVTGVLSGQPDAGTGGQYNLVLEASNGEGTDTQAFTLDIGQAPVITSADNLTCEVGQACSFTLTATGFPDPTFDLPGLPAGLTLDGVSGQLSGTPDPGTGGLYNLTVEASNSVGTDTQAFALTVNEAPTITSVDTLDCETGQPCTFSFTASGFPASTFNLPGLPAGLSLDPSGSLSGSPDGGTGGVYNLTLGATNGIAPDASQAFTLTIGQPPVITSADNLTCEVGQPCNFSLTATGFPAPTFALPGLPSGLTLDAISGQLSGTPDPGTGGLYNLTAEATNSAGTDNQAFALTINQAPQITSANSLDCLINQPCSFTVTATGYPAPGFTLPGLPTGLTINPVSGLISGTPTQGGVFNLTLGADNGVAPADSQAFTLQVGAPPQITSANATTCQVGVACNFAFTASGTPAPTITLTGALPAGVIFDGGTESLSGTAQPGSGGNYNLTVDASNGFLPDDSQAFVLTITEAPVTVDDPDGGIPTGSSPGSMPYHGAFNTNLVVSAVDGVLANDTLGFPAAAITTPNPVAGNGTVTLNADGSLVYSPDSGFTGLDSFQYCIENVVTNSCATVSVAIGERPSAVDDSYPATLLGNVAVDTALSSGYSVQNLAGGDAIVVGLDGTTNGDAVVNGDGTFIFDPAAGFANGNASLAYSVTNGFGTVTGTVTLPVGADRLWFADNALAAAGDGRLSSPFNTLSALDGAANAAGDVLFLYAGSGAYTGGLGLLNSQVLVGQAASSSLAALAGLTVPADSVLPATGGSSPLIENAGGAGVTLGSDNLLRGFGIGNTSGYGLSGNVFGTLDLAEVAIGGAGGALALNNGTAAAIFTSLNSSSSSASSVDLQTVDGSLNLGNGTLTAATGTAFRVIGGTAAVSYDGNITKDSAGSLIEIAGRAGGSVTLTGNLICSLNCNTGGGNAIDIANLSAGSVTLSGTTKNVEYTGPGTAFRLFNNAGATINLSGNMLLWNSDTALVATGGGTLNMNLADLNINTVRAIQIDGMTLTGNVPAGIIGGNGALGNGNYSISIINSQMPSGLTLNARLALDYDDGGESGGGVNLLNNSGTLSLTAWDFVTTNATPALNAANAGTLVIAPLNNGLASNTNGTAVSVIDTVIGAAGLVFNRIGSLGAGTGIILDNTGSLGGFRVNGTGTPGSGGIIANKTGADGLIDQGVGIFLADTANVELNRMQLNDFSNFAILGDSVTGFALIDSVISGSNGSNDVIDEAAVLLTNLLGSGEITRTSISGGVEDNVRVVNDSGILDRLVITDSTFSNAARPLSNDGLRVEATGTAFVGVTVANSTFSANRGDHFDGDASGSSTLDLIFTGNTLTGGHPGAVGQSFVLSNSQSADVVFDVSGNTIRDSVVNAMTFFQSATSTAASSMRGAITGNTIGVTGVNGSGSAQGSGLVVNATGLGEVTVSVLNNQIRQWSNPFGLLLQSGDPGSVLNVTASGNTIQEPNLASFPLNGLQANIGTTAAGAVNACLDIRNNTLVGSGAFGADDFRLRQRNASTVNLPGYGGAVSDTAAVVSFVQAANVGVPIGSAAYSPAGGGFTGAGAACPQP